MNTPETFSALFVAWMRKQGHGTAKDAAPAFSCSVSTAYEYANGNRVPPMSKARLFAPLLGVTERRLRKAIANARVLRTGAAHV